MHLQRLQTKQAIKSNPAQFILTSVTTKRFENGEVLQRDMDKEWQTKEQGAEMRNPLYYAHQGKLEHARKLQAVTYLRLLSARTHAKTDGRGQYGALDGRGL